MCVRVHQPQRNGAVGTADSLKLGLEVVRGAFHSPEEIAWSPPLPVEHPTRMLSEERPCEFC
jgi:hypothetical protein